MSENANILAANAVENFHLMVIDIIRNHKPEDEDPNEIKTLSKYDGYCDPKNPDRYYDPEAIDV